MNGDVVDKIEELTKKTQLHEVDGKTYSFSNMRRVHYDPVPSPLEISTLTGLADYLANGIDEHEKKKLFIGVLSHGRVALYRYLNKETMQRHMFANVEALQMAPFDYGQWIDHESFLIALRSRFKDSEDKKTLLGFLSRLVIGESIENTDDGVSQQVVVRKTNTGNLKERKDAPSLVTLTPYRTFLEVDQPKSGFTFRLRTSDTQALCALFEADGGAWRLDATKNVKDWLKANIKDVPVIA